MTKHICVDGDLRDGPLKDCPKHQTSKPRRRVKGADTKNG